MTLSTCQRPSNVKCRDRLTCWYDEICDQKWNLIGVEASIHLVESFLNLREIARSSIQVEELPIGVETPTGDSEFRREPLDSDLNRVGRWLVEPNGPRECKL
jgi:hypothetical protein